MKKLERKVIFGKIAQLSVVSKMRFIQVVKIAVQHTSN